MRLWMGWALAIGLLGSAAQAQTLHAVTNVPWRAYPNGDQMAAAQPAKARRDGVVAGWTTLECQTEPNGRLKACQTLGEGPEGYDFGKAGLSLARHFQLDTGKAAPDAMTGGVVTFQLLFNMSAPLTNFLAGNPALVLTPDPKGQTPCPTEAAPQQTCKTHRFVWASRPSFVETAPFVRAAVATPATTTLICPITPDMKLTRCLQAGAADPSQVTAMTGLIPRFTVPAQADDKTPTKDTFILVQFHWPALKHAVETSVFTKPAP